MTHIHSYTFKLGAFLLRGRGGARFRGRWIIIRFILKNIITISLISKNHRNVIVEHLSLQGYHFNFSSIIFISFISIISEN